MWLESIPKPACDSSKCPTCGGGVQRRIYGEMYAGSFISHGQRVEIRRSPREGYMDPIWLDPLAVYFERTIYRLWPSEKYWARGGYRLHRDVWASGFGPIPRACHIHHRDNDPNNNRLDNLECVPAIEHLSNSWHAGRGGRRTDKFNDEARVQAAAWHASDAGRLWHSRNALATRSWEKWPREPGPCLHCGRIFDRLIRKGLPQKYCTQTCKALNYRQRRANERNSGRLVSNGAGD